MCIPIKIFFLLLQLQGVCILRYILKNFAIRDNVPETHQNGSFCVNQRESELFTGWPPKNGTVDISGLCSDL